MGQIKNIKLHIVTDIKNTEFLQQQQRQQQQQQRDVPSTIERRESSGEGDGGEVETQASSTYTSHFLRNRLHPQDRCLHHRLRHQLNNNNNNNNNNCPW